MKLIDIHNIAGLYPKFANRTDLDVKSAYKLLKFFHNIQDDEDFYQKKVQEIIEKYGEKDEEGSFILLEGGQGVKIKEEDYDNCNNELNELSGIEVEIPEIAFSLNDIPEGLTLRELNLFMPFIKEKE